MGAAFNIIELAIARYRDVVEQESLDRLNQSFNELLLAEADYRRAKKTELIKRRGKFEGQLKNFEFIYQKIKEKHGSMPVIEDFLREILQEIKRLKLLKNQ
jgi:hypothetical protein